MLRKPFILYPTEINSIAISMLRGPVHREFAYDALTKAEECEAIVQNISVPLANFKAAVEYELQLAERLATPDTQQRLDEAKQQREDVQTGLKAGFRAMTVVNDKNVAAAAALLFSLAHRNDIHAGQNVDVQTASLRSFISAVEGHYMAELQLIGMTEQFELLKQKNDEVCDLMKLRDEQNGDFETGTFAEARCGTDEAYRWFVNAVNTFAYVQGEAAYIDYIKYLNALILRYKRTHLKQKPTTPEATPEGGTTPEGTTPEGGEQNPGGDNTDNQQPGEGDNQQPGEGNQQPTEGENGENTEGNQPEQENPNQPPPPTGGGESGFDW